MRTTVTSILLCLPFFALIPGKCTPFNHSPVNFQHTIFRFRETKFLVDSANLICNKQRFGWQSAIYNLRKTWNTHFANRLKMNHCDMIIVIIRINKIIPGSQ